MKEGERKKLLTLFVYFFVKSLNESKHQDVKQMHCIALNCNTSFFVIAYKNSTDMLVVFDFC